LTRYTLAPGAALPTETVAGYELLVVEAGTVGLTLTGEGLPSRATPGVEVPYDVGRVVQMASGTVRAVRNAGSEPVVFMLLSVVPVEAGSGQGTPAP
jgi:quercetin dioxygenase-like cupin family protein